MAFWTVSFGDRMLEAVKFTEQMNDLVEFEHSDLFYRIDRKGIAKSRVEATAQLTLFFLKHVSPPLYPSDSVKNVWQDLKSSALPAENVQKIRDAMAAVGYDPEHPSA